MPSTGPRSEHSSSRARPIRHNGGVDLSPDEIAARAELGKALRRLHHAFVGRHSEAGELTTIAWQLDEITDRLEKGDQRLRPLDMTAHADELVDDGAIMATLTDRPFSGHGSPYGLEFVVRRDGDNAVITTLTLGPAHEGPPGRAHGGIVAGFFDDLTGYVLHIRRIHAFTGELTVRYEAPVPLGVALEAKAWLTETVGRKQFVMAELRAGDVVVARCKATYINVAAPPSPT